MEEPKLSKQSPIDRNHSHFILVDNGTQRMFGTEIAFRAKLESAISELKTDTGEGGGHEGRQLNVVFFIYQV